MKRKHCFDSVGRESVSGDAAGDTGRGHPVREWNDSISHPEERQWSLREEWPSPLDGKEFSADQDRQWSACLSLLEAGEELKKIFN